MTLTFDERYQITYALRELANRRFEQAQDYADSVENRQALRLEGEELRKLADRIVEEDSAEKDSVEAEHREWRRTRDEHWRSGP